MYSLMVSSSGAENCNFDISTVDVDLIRSAWFVRLGDATTSADRSTTLFLQTAPHWCEHAPTVPKSMPRAIPPGCPRPPRRNVRG